MSRGALWAGASARLRLGGLVADGGGADDEFRFELEADLDPAR